ncbi:MAG: hypothetical protein J0H21_10440 [Rhizobiales bacterium]|nr:hypothetical protein [Hyphomicrobiales bacterium]
MSVAGILGKKIGMTQIFDDHGDVHPVTVLKAGPCVITQLKTIEKQLVEAAATGVAIEIGENEEGTMCMGVAILDESGYPVAAISISAPERRVTAEIRPRLIERLKEATAEISQKLASSPWQRLAGD